ncbi:lysozyme inhibitor LprI family protein [Methylovirgula sp. 4M-Z18]|uniref:lysozyme inhibitor LprI family protein n=1 Tax=Methylovirgula sp. 4M-Z18 TaxID=2293567 RepID=UPI000E2F11AE|nr:lysozyme inhibitor LprI family protein [Methylovirgula sp. 4M-Z18]RFB74980.1 DUF1311 domain-containing protein [Methylovirgula sp. 4M-Z18]
MWPFCTKAVVTLALALAVMNGARAAPSFDCAKASTPVERAICSDPDLGNLDATLASVLKEALGRAGPSRDDLLRQQREWLASRNDCASEKTPLKTAICLQKSYTEQINQLRLFASPLKDGSAPLCHVFAERIEALSQADANIFAPTRSSSWFGRTALDILADDKSSELILNKDASHYSTVAELLAAFAKAAQPATLSDKTKAVIDEDFAGSSYLYLYRLPQSDLYVVGTVQGTLSCTVHDWFEIRDGHMEPMDSLDPEDKRDDGNMCGALEDRLGVFKNIPVRLALTWQATPDLPSVVEIEARVGDAWAPACSVRFEFAPTFDLNQSLNQGEKSCTFQNCSKLYDEALRLVVAFQNRRSDQIGTMSQAERNTFDAIQTLWSKDTPAPDFDQNRDQARQPDTALDTNPMILPSVVDDKVYLVTLGHRTIGWRIFGDWEVKFWSLAGDHLENVATTTVGMARGKLLNVNVTEPTQ